MESPDIIRAAIAALLLFALYWLILCFSTKNTKKMKPQIDACS